MQPQDHPTTTHHSCTPSAPHGRPATDGEDGSLVAEYGLLAILGATITGIAISWAQGGAVAGLLDAVLRQVRTLAGL